jgi:hypothetical protein
VLRVPAQLPQGWRLLGCAIAACQPSHPAVALCQFAAVAWIGMVCHEASEPRTGR